VSINVWREKGKKREEERNPCCETKECGKVDGDTPVQVNADHPPPVIVDPWHTCLLICSSPWWSDASLGHISLFFLLELVTSLWESQLASWWMDSTQHYKFYYVTSRFPWFNMSVCAFELKQVGLSLWCLLFNNHLQKQTINLCFRVTNWNWTSYIFFGFISYVCVFNSKMVGSKMNDS
jgi:hypothetical protein